MALDMSEDVECEKTRGTNSRFRQRARDGGRLRETRRRVSSSSSRPTEALGV